jgi:EAL domain-containing protein (putative c-di-GMP-specific phosphodiesterase class I)
VLGQAVRQGAAWLARGMPVPIAINVSALQFQQPQFIERVAAVLATSGLPPQMLELELTESILVRDADEALQRLQSLARVGVRLSIDDFGTGYSSLSYLRQFPMDGVKIAKPVVDHIADGADDSALARAIITIGETLELEVIAEGIEHEEQMRVLQKLGCKLGQGFYSSRPLPAELLIELLQGRTVRAS